MPTIIGRQLQSNDLLTIGDNERRSGLYILGKPRMGKSWLLVSLIAQDIENGHGIFFIDPHGDAINDLLTRFYIHTPVEQYIIFDPEDQHTSFGINILECKYIANLKARNDTFTRAKSVFDKLWKTRLRKSRGCSLYSKTRSMRLLRIRGTQ